MLELRVAEVTQTCAHLATTCPRSIKLRHSKHLVKPSFAPALKGATCTSRLKAKQRHLNRVATALWNSSSGSLQGKNVNDLYIHTLFCQALLSRSMLAGSNGSGTAPPVQVTVERGARNSRRLYAAVEIAAPVEVVWGALTDYQGLGNFIPGTLHASCTNKKQNRRLVGCRPNNAASSLVVYRVQTTSPLIVANLPVALHLRLLTLGDILTQYAYSLNAHTCSSAVQG